MSEGATEGLNLRKHKRWKTFFLGNLRKEITQSFLYQRLLPRMDRIQSLLRRLNFWLSFEAVAMSKADWEAVRFLAFWKVGSSVWHLRLSASSNLPSARKGFAPPLWHRFWNGGGRFRFCARHFCSSTLAVSFTTSNLVRASYVRCELQVNHASLSGSGWRTPVAPGVPAPRTPDQSIQRRTRQYSPSSWWLLINGGWSWSEYLLIMMVEASSNCEQRRMVANDGQAWSNTETFARNPWNQLVHDNNSHN